MIVIIASFVAVLCTRNAVREFGAGRLVRGVTRGLTAFILGFPLFFVFQVLLTMELEARRAEAFRQELAAQALDERNATLNRMAVRLTSGGLENLWIRAMSELPNREVILGGLNGLGDGLIKVNNWTSIDQTFSNQIRTLFGPSLNGTLPFLGQAEVTAISWVPGGEYLWARGRFVYNQRQGGVLRLRPSGEIDQEFLRRISSPVQWGTKRPALGSCSFFGNQGFPESELFAISDQLALVSGSDIACEDEHDLNYFQLAYLDASGALDLSGAPGLYPTPDEQSGLAITLRFLDRHLDPIQQIRAAARIPFLAKRSLVEKNLGAEISRALADADNVCLKRRRQEMLDYRGCNPWEDPRCRAGNGRLEVEKLVAAGSDAFLMELACPVKGHWAFEPSDAVNWVVTEYMRFGFLLSLSGKVLARSDAFEGLERTPRVDIHRTADGLLIVVLKLPGRVEIRALNLQLQQVFSRNFDLVEESGVRLVSTSLLLPEDTLILAGSFAAVGERRAKNLIRMTLQEIFSGS